MQQPVICDLFQKQLIGFGLPLWYLRTLLSSLCETSGNRRVIFVKTSMISKERGTENVIVTKLYTVHRYNNDEC
jgi:hypothetical protein